MPLTNHPYKYNGVELNESLGLNLYEMDFRQYDPAIARFTSIDPVTHWSMSTYTGFDNNPVYWADPSGADGIINWGNQNEAGAIELAELDHKYGSNHSTTKKKKENKKKNSDVMDIDINKLSENLNIEFGLNSSSNLSVGEAVVNTYLSQIILKVYLDALIELFMSTSGHKTISYIPTSAVRLRTQRVRNWRKAMKQNRNYGSISFSHEYSVNSVAEYSTSGDYGYLYNSGTNVATNNMGADNLVYTNRNSYGDGTFSGYSYILFKDREKNKVGELLFRTEELKDKFIHYFNIVLKEKFKKSLQKKNEN